MYMILPTPLAQYSYHRSSTNSQRSTHTHSSAPPACTLQLVANARHISQSRHTHLMQDCAWREYAYEYAVQVQPWLASDVSNMRELFDALQLQTLCQKDRYVSGCHTFYSSVRKSCIWSCGDARATQMWSRPILCGSMKRSELEDSHLVGLCESEHAMLVLVV